MSVCFVIVALNIYGAIGLMITVGRMTMLVRKMVLMLAKKRWNAEIQNNVNDYNEIGWATSVVFVLLVMV